MATKILSFPDNYFQRRKQWPLSSGMIGALLQSYAKQKAGIAFGPQDIKGSFSSLISRGLIIRKEITIKGQKGFQWQVTNEAIARLRDMGMHA